MLHQESYFASFVGITWVTLWRIARWPYKSRKGLPKCGKTSRKRSFIHLRTISLRFHDMFSISNRSYDLQAPLLRQFHHQVARWYLYHSSQYLHYTSRHQLANLSLQHKKHFSTIEGSRPKLEQWTTRSRNPNTSTRAWTEEIAKIDGQKIYCDFLLLLDYFLLVYLRCKTQ